jgi:hypothetical protein
MLITRAPALVTWLPALQGLVLGIAFLYIGRKVDTVRFPIAGVLCAIAGLLLSVLHLGENLATAALFGWLGSIMVAGGALAFRAYLRHAPPPEEA